MIIQILELPTDSGWIEDKEFLEGKAVEITKPIIKLKNGYSAITGNLLVPEKFWHINIIICRCKYKVLFK